LNTYFGWLEEAEKDLSCLRSPISILLQAEKSSLISVLDSYLPNYSIGKEHQKKSESSRNAIIGKNLKRGNTLLI